MNEVKPLDQRTIEILKQQEPLFIHALEFYYSNLDTLHGKTFNQSAHEAGVNPAYLVDCLFFCPVSLGVPETREEAQSFL